MKTMIIEPRHVNQLSTKFSVIKENTEFVRDSVASGTLSDAIRASRQLAYSANSLVRFLEDIDNHTFNFEIE